MLSYEQIKEIFDTLPIGYYIGRDVPATLSMTSQDSYYDIIRDEITISYPTLADRLGSVEGDIEENCRCLLYHELSHALLTPAGLKNDAPCVNIFEDERIETLCAHTYMGVDFKKFTAKANHFDFQPPENADDYFYQCVRYRIGEREDLNLVANMIRRFKYFTRAVVDSWTCENYKDCIHELYNEITSHWKDRNNGQENQGGQSGQSNLSGQSGLNAQNIQNVQGTQSGRSSQSGQNVQDGQDEQNGQDRQEGQNSQDGQDKQDGQEGQEGQNGQEEEGQDGQDIQSGQEGQSGQEEGQDLEKLLDEMSKNADKESWSERQQYSRAGRGWTPFHSITDSFKAHDYMKEDIGMILDEFKSNERANASAIAAYSGKMNPMLVARKDYRWWEKANRYGNYKQFSKLKLNIFIDRTGSFYEDVDTANQILSAVAEVEKATDKFEFDVIRCGVGEEIAEKSSRFTCGEGGTTLTSEIYEIYDKVQDPDAENINIVLYDGEMNEGENLVCFDHSNCTLILDPSVKRYWGEVLKGMTEAKIIISSHYTDKLYENVLEALRGLV